MHSFEYFYFKNVIGTIDYKLNKDSKGLLYNIQ
jgi:hypothetical protein